MYENDGSSALKEAYTYEEVNRPKKVSDPKRRPRRRGITGEQKAAIFVSVIAVSMMALAVLSLMANLNTSYKTLNEKKNQLSSLESQVEQLSSKAEGAAAFAATEEQAAELGLYKPGKEQIVYIELDSADEGEILAEDNSNSGIRAFFNKVAAIAEYFY